MFEEVKNQLKNISKEVEELVKKGKEKEDFINEHEELKKLMRQVAKKVYKLESMCESMSVDSTDFHRKFIDEMENLIAGEKEKNNFVYETNTYHNSIEMKFDTRKFDYDKIKEMAKHCFDNYRPVYNDLSSRIKYKLEYGEGKNGHYYILQACPVRGKDELERIKGFFKVEYIKRYKYLEFE